MYELLWKWWNPILYAIGVFVEVRLLNFALGVLIFFRLLIALIADLVEGGGAEQGSSH